MQNQRCRCLSWYKTESLKLKHKEYQCQVVTRLTVPPRQYSSGISSLGFFFLLSVSGSFPAAGGGGCPAGRGPEGAAGAHAGQA